MTTCGRCGVDGQDDRFCTRCGSAVVAPAAATAARSVRPIWVVLGALASVLVIAFTAVVVLRSGATESAGQPVTPVDDQTAAPATAGSTDPAPASSSPASTPVALPLNPTVIVLDASGSMTTPDAPGPRIDAAKKAVTTLVDVLPDGAPLGLLVFGTATDSSDEAKVAGCQDIRTLVELGPVDRAAFGAAVSGVVASGYTPLGAALRAAVAELPADGPRNIVLVSDGIDRCAPPEPCGVAAELVRPGLAIHTVGFRVDDVARQQLNCIAGAAGGSYVDADNAAQLAARLRSAVDPNTAVNTLTRTGFGGLELGMTVAQAQQIDPSITAGESGTVRIVWRDCELAFTDGKLTGITSTSTVRTQDGLAVGDDVSRAVELYGTGTVQASSGSARLVVPTGDSGNAGFDISFVPDAADPTAARGRITTIVLCLCRPSGTGAFTQVNADDYVKSQGRWWFRTPDETWSCAIGTNVYITGHDERVGTFCENQSGTEPPVAEQDKYVDCDFARRGGWVVSLSGAADYGSCMKGDASEFVYHVDEGVPGPGKVLPDHQVLVAGGYRCFVDGNAVTCANLTTGVGFTVGPDGYRLHPRDGAAPDPGTGSEEPTATETPSGGDVLGPDGYRSLKIGMTLQQAQAADPSVTGSFSTPCIHASSNSADSILFNPDGTLSMITPKGNPPTPEGLRVGDTVERAYQLYAPDQPRLLPENPSAVSFPVTPGSTTEYLIFFRRPSEGDNDATHADVSGIYLNRDQRCVG